DRLPDKRMNFLEKLFPKPRLVPAGGAPDPAVKAPAARGAGGPSKPAPKPAPKAKAAEPLTVAQRRRMASRPPSFTQLLPWTKYDPDRSVFELIDGESLGMVFELAPVATEARPDEFLRNQAYRIQEALQAIPETEAGSPWIVQFFCNDDRN